MKPTKRKSARGEIALIEKPFAVDLPTLSGIYFLALLIQTGGLCFFVDQSSPKGKARTKNHGPKMLWLHAVTP